MATSKITEAELAALQKRIAQCEKSEAEIALLHKQIEAREKRLVNEKKEFERERNELRSEKERYRIELAKEKDDRQRLEREINDLREDLINQSNREPEMPSYEHSPRRHQYTESPIVNSKTYSLKDALELVPIYSGKNDDTTIYQFIRACNRAYELLGPSNEKILVEMLKLKLRGPVLEVMEDERFDNIRDFTNQLRLTFGPQRDFDYYRGELARVTQKHGENIHDYIKRVRKLKNTMVNILQTHDRYLDNEFSTDHVETLALKYFTIGLLPHVKYELKWERCETFNEACCKAIRICAQEEEHRRNRQSEKPKSNLNPQAPTFQTKSFQQRYSNSAISPLKQNEKNLSKEQPVKSEPPTVTCNYCKYPGHTINECRKLEKKNREMNLAKTQKPMMESKAVHFLEETPTTIEQDVNYVHETLES